MRHIVTWTAAVAIPAAGLGWMISGFEMALGVIAGAALGGLNFLLLGRSLQQMFANPEEHRTGSKWAVPATMLLKWPLLLGALAIIMLYLPVNPIGVATGAGLSLVAGVTAAAREQRKSNG